MPNGYVPGGSHQTFGRNEMDINKHFESVKKSLQDDGFDVTYLEQLGSVLTKVAEQSRDVAFAEFHNHAGKYPIKNDSDVGALILEREADLNAREPLKMRLYREASWRAKWCATSATSGSEALARSNDIERLLNKLK